MPTRQEETETAVDVGQFTLGIADARIIDRRKFVDDWRRVDEEGKPYRDSWNSNVPGKESKYP